MYKKIAMLIYLMILISFIACSKDNTISEDTSSCDVSAEVHTNSSTPTQISIDFTAQISKLEELAKLTAKEWNPELANYFYNYFSKTDQYGIELVEVKTKLEKDVQKPNRVIQIFSNFTDVHLDAKDGPHPIEIYIPKIHVSLLDRKAPIFAFYDGTKDEKNNGYSKGFLSDGSSIKVDNNIMPKDQPVIVFRFKERVIENANYEMSNLKSQEQNSLTPTQSAGTCNEKFYVSGISFKNFGATREHWIAYPPEYYTKTWPCLDSNSCNITWSPQRHDVRLPQDWNPPLEFDYQFVPCQWYNTYVWDRIMFDHTGGSLYYPRLKVELWEEDWWAPDDFIDRLMKSMMPIHGGWNEFLFKRNGGNCMLKIKRHIWQ